MPSLRRGVTRPAAAAVLALGLVCAGCDGGDGDERGTTGATGSGSSPSTDTSTTTSSGPVTASTGIGRPDPRVPVGAPATVLVVPLDVADPAGGWFITADLPQLEGLGDADAEAAIDAELMATARALVDSWQERFAGRPRDRDGGPTASLVATFEVEWFDERSISIWFDVRVADGEERRSVALTATFDLRDGSRLTLDDVLRDAEEPWPVVVSHLVVTELVARLAPDDPALADSIAAGASASPQNFPWFTLGPNGLTLVFEEFQLGPGELGAPVVELAWSDLGLHIDPAGPAATLAPPAPTTTTTTTPVTASAPTTTMPAGSGADAVA